MRRRSKFLIIAAALVCLSAHSVAGNHEGASHRASLMTVEGTVRALTTEPAEAGEPTLVVLLQLDEPTAREIEVRVAPTSTRAMPFSASEAARSRLRL